MAAPTKRFPWGTRKAGTAHAIGQPEGAAWLLVAEGYATAASCFEATGRPVFVAWDEGNLANVVRALRGRYPSARILVCGDDDRATEARTGKNPGRLSATKAARLARGLAVFPGDELPAGGSDFNDLHQAAGLDAVRRVIEAAIEAAESAATDDPSRTPGRAKKTAPAARQRVARPDADEAGASRAGVDRFRVDEAGLWFDAPADDGGGGRSLRVCGPLHVVARASDAQDNGAMLLLEFDTPFVSGRRWLMPLSMLAGDGTAYRAELLSKWFVTPPDAKRRALLTEYLNTRQPSEFVRHTARVGWSGSCYVLPHETLGNAPGDRVVFHSDAGIEVNFGQRGSLDRWQQSLARLCVGNSRLAFATSVAFAGPLLAWSPVKGGGGFHFVGDTSIGKTTGLLIAASVWGKGTENDPESFMQKWRATSNGLEFQGEQHNDCTLILDELGQIEANEAGPAAYMLADGMGKARSKAGGGLRHKPTWRLLFLSSGELTLAQHMEAAGKRMKGGQEVRLIPLPAEVSPGSTLETTHEFEGGHELSEWVKRHAATVYGCAGRAWLLWLTENTGRLPALIREHMNAFESRYVRDESSGQVKRGARRFALAAAAGEIATAEAGLTGWPKGEAMTAAGTMFQAWIATRPGGTGTSEEAQILRDVRQHFGMFGEMNYKRWGVTDSDHAKDVPMMCGWRRPIMGDERNEAGDLIRVEVSKVWYVLAEQFRAVVCKGHNPKTVLDVLKSRDLIELEPSGRALHNARPLGYSKDGASVYRVKGAILNTSDE